jgi:uncharacterized protein YbjT (DUF2867 family)
MKALILGASGLCGRACLNKLLEDSYYEKVEIWVRKSQNISHPKLIEKIINFSDISEMGKTDANHVYCSIGTTIKKAETKRNFFEIEHNLVLKIASAVANSNCEKFLYISSLGAYPGSNNFYLRTKGQVEEGLKTKEFKCLCIFRPSLLLGKRNEFRFGEKIAQKIMPVFNFLLRGKNIKYRPVKASLVAEKMIAIAKTNLIGVQVFESNDIQK